MLCINCTNATTKHPNGGKSSHRAVMFKLGFVGCKKDPHDGKTYSIELERNCNKFVRATEDQIEKRKTNAQ